MRNLIFVIAVVVLFAAPAAAADLGYEGFSVRAGLLVPTDWDNGFQVGAAVDLGEVWVDGLRLLPGISYAAAEETVSSAGGIGADLEVTDIAVGAEVHYYLAGEPAGWYFGGGPYLHFVERDVVVSFFGERANLDSVDGEEIGVTGVAGYRMDFGGLGLLGEARYQIATGVDGFVLAVGVAF